MNKKLTLFFVLGMPLCQQVAVASSQEIDGYSIEMGYSEDNARMVRAGLRWDWDKSWSLGNHWKAGGYWEASLGYWHGTGRGETNLWDIGFTPVFRFYPLSMPGPISYLEAAIGVHLLSTTHINDSREFGSSFQFGDHIGLGILFGNRSQYDLGYRFQHLSNAGIAQPNDGINFHQVRLSYFF